MRDVIETIRTLFTSRYVLHLEREVEYLRGRCAQLELRLTPPPAPVVKREFPKFTPARTSWESYLAEQIALQESEAVADGVSSSGRQ